MILGVTPKPPEGGLCAALQSCGALAPFRGLGVTQMKITPMTRLLLTFTLLFSTATAFAQTPGYRIEGRIRGLRDTTVTLAHYFGQNQYVPKDTARIDSSSRFVFEGKKTLPQGVYIALLPLKKQRYVELLLGTSAFSFETDTINPVANMRISGSPDNEAFYAYQKQLLTLTDERNALNIQAQFRTDEVAKLSIRRQLVELQRQAIQLQKTTATVNDSLLVRSDRKSTRLNSSHSTLSRMPSSA